MIDRLKCLYLIDLPLHTICSTKDAAQILVVVSKRLTTIAIFTKRAARSYCILRGKNWNLYD